MAKKKEPLHLQLSKIMPKTNKIAPKNEKRTDIFGINPIVS